MSNVWVMQGDSYAMPFVLRMIDGTLITEDMVEIVALNLNGLSRQYPGDVTYDSGKWFFPLTQKQTLSIKGSITPQARVKFKDGSAFGGQGRKIPMVDAFNKGILGTDGKGSSAPSSDPVSIEICAATTPIQITVSASGPTFSFEGAVRYDEQQNLTPEQQEQARENIGAGTSNFDGSYNSLTDKPESYNLPVASEESLGGVKAVPKTDEMTEQVGVDESGALWYKPGTGGTSEIPTADEVLFTKDLVLTEQFGRYVPVDGKVTVPAENISVQAVVLDAFSQDKNPTITQPSVSVSSSTARAYEVGTSVTPAYNGSLNPGAYEYKPKPTGVVAQSWSAVNNVTSEQIATQSGTFAAYIVPDGANYKITLNCTYSDGEIPFTALDQEYPAGQIKGGTKSATTGAITGYRNSFYGTTTDKEATTDSAVIRGLAQKSNRAYTNGSTFSVTIPVGALRVIIAYPATLRDVTNIKDVNGLNADITTAFTQATVEVEGAASYLSIPYKVYTLDFATPNDTKNTYNVTI